MRKYILVFLAAMMIVTKIYAQKPELTLNIGHSGAIKYVRLSPDCRYAVSIGTDDAIVLWDLKSEKEIRRISPDKSRPRKIIWNPDGSSFAAIIWNEVKEWDAKNGNLIAELKFKNEVEGMFYSSSGNKMFISGEDDKIFLYEKSSDGKVRTFEKRRDEGTYECEVSDDRTKFAVTDADNSIKIYDMNTAELTEIIMNSEGNVLRFSPDGKYIARANQNNVLFLFDAVSGAVIREFPQFQSQMRDAIFTPDGKKLITSFDKTEIWDVSTGKKTGELPGDAGQVNSFDISKDGNLLIGGSSEGGILLWNLRNGEMTGNMKGRTSALHSVELSSDNTLFAVSFDFNKAFTWFFNRNKTNKVTVTSQNYIWDLSYSRNKQYILSGSWDGTASFADQNIKKLISVFKNPDGKVSAVDLSADNSKCLTMGYSNKVYLWNAADGNLIKKLEYEGSQKSCRFSPSGDEFFISDSKNMRIYRTTDQVLQRTFSGNFKGQVTVSPSGKLFAVESDGKILVMDFMTGSVFSSLSGYEGFSYNIAFSPDEKQIASSHEKEIKVWSVSNGSLLRTMSGHKNEIGALNFSEKGDMIISGDKSGAVKIWNAQTGELMITVYGLSATEDWVAVSPDGRFDGTESGIKILHYVNNNKIIPLESFFNKFYTPKLYERIMSGDKLEKLDFRPEDMDPAPLVEISKPADNYISEKKEITVELKITDQGGDVNEIYLYHNGKLVNTMQRGLNIQKKKNFVLNEAFKIILTNGNNHIKAVALNAQKTESAPAEINVVFNGSKAGSKLYVLAIGIDVYKKSQLNLNYAAADASAFIKKIEEGSKTIFSGTEVLFLKNLEVTKTRISDTFGELKGKITQDDVFIFYYAGHGIMSESDSPEFHIIPSDVTKLYDNEVLGTLAISAKELQEYSKALPAQKQLFVLDACQAGGMNKTLASRGAAEEKAIAQLARSTGTFWLTAANSDQFSTELAELGHGIFTYSVIKGLEGDADGSTKDKKITVKELSAYLDDKVPELSEKYKGTAQYPNIYGWGMDFPIVTVP